MLYFAVPFISQELEPSATQQLWIFDIYGFVLAGMLITMGALGDRIGRRRLLLMGAAAFGAASLLAAYATDALTSERVGGRSNKHHGEYEPAVELLGGSPVRDSRVQIVI